MKQSLQQEKKSDGEVLSVHRPISRAKWLTIHKHSAAEYCQSEWNLPQFRLHRQEQFELISMCTEHENSVVYQIRIKGHLDQTWSDWFSPLTIANHPQGEATLIGEVRDQAELYGLLDKVFNLNLTLLAVTIIKTEMEN